MLTDKQRAIFSEILDLNWSADREKDFKKRLKLLMQLSDKQRELKEDMGEDAYNDFMNKGKKMFS